MKRSKKLGSRRCHNRRPDGKNPIGHAGGTHETVGNANKTVRGDPHEIGGSIRRVY